MNLDGTCGTCGAYCGGCSPSTPSVSAPTVREAGDEGIAAVLAAGWSDHWANRPNDHVFDGLAAALAPLIAERERAAGERALREAAVDVGPALANEVGGHTSTYSVRRWLHERADRYIGPAHLRAALAPETPGDPT